MENTSLDSEKKEFVSLIGPDEFCNGNEKEWFNWARTINFTPEDIFCPKTLDELKAYVKNARDNNKKIRCATQGHSWSTLSVTQSCLVILCDNLSNVEAEKKKNENGDDYWVAHIEAGATIAKVDEYLRKHEPPLAIESMTVLDTIRFGGTIATGCHGAITDSRTLAEQVVGLEIVTSSGEVKKFEYDPNNPDEMEAARVNLGLFGVIYKISFLVKPMYKLRMRDTYPELKSFTGENIKDLVKDPIVDGIEIFYWPFNESHQSTDPSKDKLWIKIWDNVTKDQQPSLNQDQVKAFRRKQEGFSRLANGFYKHLIDDPTTTPKIAYKAGLLRKEFIDDKINNLIWEVPDATHYQAGIDNILCRDLEFAIKADKDFNNVITELNYIVNRIYEEKKKQKYPINLVVELRILKSSTALLSTAYDEDPDAYYFFIEVLSFRYFNRHDNTCIDTKDYEEFSIELAQRWMEKYNARPHWAKSWENVPNIKGYLHNLLKERIQRFEAVRAKYDPTNMFFDNDSLREVFYGPGNLK